MAAVDGAPGAVAELLDSARLPASAQLLGPVTLDAADEERMLVRVPRADGRALAAALAAAQSVRAARKATEPVRVRLDPVELG
jgi:primosomal protein N' (replication factor Y)